MARATNLFLLAYMALTADSMPEITVGAKDTLYAVEDRVTISSISDPVPIYRKDLGEDFVAYWSFLVNGDQQIIISSGPQTGDHKLVFQGPLPALTKLLDDSAVDSRKKCHTYFMLTPDVTMMCESREGRVVATSREAVEPHDANDTSLRYQFVENNLHLLKKDWEERAAEVKEEEVWDDTDFVPTGSDPNGHSLDEGLQILQPGHTYKIPVGGSETVKIVPKGVSLENLCEMLQICSADDDGLVDTSSPETTPYGFPFVPLTIPEDIKTQDFRFDLHIITETGIFIKRFYVAINVRAKRGVQQSTWFNSSTWYYKRIKDEVVFPDYDQFKNGKCSVGSGPVAWAMIFGYFDRRSHAIPTYGPGSQKLYKCGSDGARGSAKCQAPNRNGPRVMNYIRKLKGIVKAVCISGEGTTSLQRMRRVKRFFKARQGTGSPKIVSGNALFGVNSKKIRSKGFAAIRAGWPIIVGIQVNGLFAQHYSVATRYRTRVQHKKRCHLLTWFCFTKVTTQYQLYTRMGLGGRQDGWKSQKMSFVTYAKY